MHNNIICFDVETTGLSPKTDHIIQLAAVKFDRNTYEIIDKMSTYVKPLHAYEITGGAIAAHGLTKEFIEERGVDIRGVAPLFIEFAKDCDILTYNGNSFDIQFIYNDFREAGYEFPMEGRLFYDSYALECNYHPRDLGSVYRQYTGQDLVGAHDAFNDVLATIEVFKAQHDVIEDIESFEGNRIISPEGSIKKVSIGDRNDVIVFRVGKYKDTEFMEVCRKDMQYVQWFMENVASSATKNILREYYKANRNPQTV